MEIDNNGAEDCLAESDEIITLISADGEEVDFFQIAGLSVDENFYTILKPVESMEGVTEEDALVFKVNMGEDGEGSFYLETDENMLARIYEEYLKLLDEMELDGEEIDK